MYRTTSTPQHRALGDQTWQGHAACRSTPHHQVDPELFFPEPDEMDRIHAAKALCAQCPVRRSCLDAALENGDTVGIRAGMTEEERDDLHKNLEHRLDYARVNETLAGRDIFLTRAERQAVVRAAYQADIPTDRLATLLKITEEHAKKLYRRTRREIRNRAAEQHGHAEQDQAAPSAQEPHELDHPQARIPARDSLGRAA